MIADDSSPARIDMRIPVPLAMLHEIAHEVAAAREATVETVFDDVGLLLDEPPVAHHYAWCTPTNVLTFARTGGDGVHYSYLPSWGGLDGIDPVFMTLPCDSGRTVVVAESFEEFFAHGYHVGWFSLEQIVYQGERAVPYFAAPDPQQSPQAEALLQLLRERLFIEREPLSLARFETLQDLYLGALTLPDELRDLNA